MDVTFAVSSLGNVDALQLCLASVLNAETVPGKIMLRFEGSLPSFARFYLEQLADLARLKGVEWSMTLDRSKGIRYARDWMLHNCRTEYLWMGDDDVIYDWDCLTQFRKVIHPVGGVSLFLSNQQAAWVCGVKVDVNNRRKYADYSQEIRSSNLPMSQNHFYSKQNHSGLCYRFDKLDTGNVIFNVPRIKGKLSFQVFKDSANGGAEDACFALKALQMGYSAFLAPAAQSIHLEKEQVYFNELRNRQEIESLARQLLNTQAVMEAL